MSEVRNLYPDPHCYKQRDTWMGATPTQNGDKWRYEKRPNYNSALFAWWPASSNALMAGRVLYARVITDVQEVVDNLAVENATTIVRRDGWITARVADDNTSNHTLPLRYGPLVLDEVAVYTSEDWDKVYGLYQRGELTRPWFAGDLLPAEAGGGYLFLSVIHMLLSLWGWRHERGRGDHEPVRDAIRDEGRQLSLELDHNAARVGQIRVHGHESDDESAWHIRIQNGCRHSTEWRHARVRVLLRATRSADRAGWALAAAHIGHGHDRGRGHIRNDGLGRWSRLPEHRKRTMDTQRRRPRHDGGLCRVQRGRLDEGPRAARGWRPDHAVVRTATRRGHRGDAPTGPRTVACAVASRWEVAA